MEKQVIFKEAICVFYNKEHDAYIGYEMGCLISAEFTPYPDYNDTVPYVREFIEKYGFGIVDFSAWLKERSAKWKGIGTPPAWDIYGEVEHYLHDLEVGHQSKMY